MVKASTRYDHDSMPHFVYTSFEHSWCFTWNGKQDSPINVHDEYQGRILDTFLITEEGRMAYYAADPGDWVTWFKGACDNYIKLHKKKDPTVVDHDVA